MACLRKRNRKKGFVWIVDYYDNNGQRHWFNTKTSNRKLAEQIKAKIEVDLNLDTLDIRKKKAMRFSELIETYLKYSKAEHDESTYVLNERFLGYFLEFVRNVQIDRITRHNIEDYKIFRIGNVSKSSVNMEIRHLKAAFSFAVDVGKYLQENPFRGVKQYKIEGNNLPEFLTLEDIEKFKSVIDDPHFMDLVNFYLCTGSRRNEALNLTWDNINFETQKIKITETKSGKDRVLPIKEELLGILKRRKENGGKLFDYSGDYVTHKIKKYLRAASLNESFNVHSLRHTFASHLVMNGTDLYTVQQLLGHSSIKVTEKYAHLAPDYLVLGVTRLPY